MCLFSLLFFVFWLCFCCSLRVFGCCVFLFSLWNHIISVHHEPEAYYSIGFYYRIHTASKYLHNDLARAIKALEQKKNRSSAQQYATTWREPQRRRREKKCVVREEKRSLTDQPSKQFVPIRTWGDFNSLLFGNV